MSGLAATLLGRRKSLILAGLLFFLSALGSFRPEFLFFNEGVPTLSLLVAFNLYRVLGGVGVGLASAICPMYIAEVAPSSIRGTLVSWNQFAIIFGQLVVYFVNFIVSSTFLPMYNMSLGSMENFGHVFTYLLYGIICLVAAVFVWKLVPETKGKSLEDMNKLWKK